MSLVLTWRPLWLIANGDTKGPYTDERATELSLSLDKAPSVGVLRGSVTSNLEEGKLTLVASHAEGASEARITLAP